MFGPGPIPSALEGPLSPSPTFPFPSSRCYPSVSQSFSSIPALGRSLWVSFTPWCEFLSLSFHPFWEGDGAFYQSHFIVNDVPREKHFYEYRQGPKQLPRAPVITEEHPALGPLLLRLRWPL